MEWVSGFAPVPPLPDGSVFSSKFILRCKWLIKFCSLRPMSVAAGTYGTVGGGFIRVNGNPMDQSGGMNMNSGDHNNKVPPGSPYPPSAPPSMVHNHVGPCSGKD